MPTVTKHLLVSQPLTAMKVTILCVNCVTGLFLRVGQLSPEKRMQYLSTHAKFQSHLEEAALLSDRVNNFYNDYNHSILRPAIEDYRKKIKSNMARDGDNDEALSYLQLMSAHMDNINSLEVPLSFDVTSKLDKQIHAMYPREYSSVLIVVAVFLLLGVIVIFSMYLLHMTSLFKFGRELVRVASSLFEIRSSATDEKNFREEPDQDIGHQKPVFQFGGDLE